MLKRLINPLQALRKQPTEAERTGGNGKLPAGSKAPGQLNPYVEARREWNERYGDYVQQAHHWRSMAIISGLIALTSVVGVVYIGAQNKIVPYVVEVDKLGQAAAVARADQPVTVDPRVTKAYLARFVADWRTVTIDRMAQKGAIDRVYSMLPSGSVALNKLNDHFKAHNPFTVAANQTVAVAVTNILPISDQTWQVEWQEVTRDLRGELQSNVRMKVSIIVGITPPTDERMILINPLGVYITDLNWSQQL
ncbi:VirB8/TrbF family protein [Chitinivorax sp. B]|uniref:VirB8/TrbF family protein n=1 Tax=Chitinivorax sp. B TaxID=2502235 RepID=UPI0010F905F3|nr:VirB8/TrbF family protein [Chitinivorax sp. B]